MRPILISGVDFQFLKKSRLVFLIKLPACQLWSRFPDSLEINCLNKMWVISQERFPSPTIHATHFAFDWNVPDPEVIVLSSPAPVVVWKSIHLQKLLPCQSSYTAKVSLVTQPMNTYAGAGKLFLKNGIYIFIKNRKFAEFQVLKQTQKSSNTQQYIFLTFPKKGMPKILRFYYINCMLILTMMTMGL